MLLTLVLWALMGGVAYAVGIGLVPPGTFARVGDRIVAALWVGFVVVSNVWLALALVMPLTFWRTLGLTALGVAGLWLYRRRRTPEWTWLPKVDFAAVPPLLWFIGALGLAELALLRSEVVAYGDTPNYHYQAVLWLETYGVTPGVVLLDCRLGFSSTWYASVAPFDACAWWHKRVGGAGGFPMALLWFHIWLAVARARRDMAQCSDWFMLLTGGLMFALFTYSYVSLDSLSTDTPTLTLVVAAVWTWLRCAEISQNDASNQTQTAGRTTYPTLWLPVALGFGAFASKLSAVTAMIGVTLWALWQTRRQPAAVWLRLLGVGVLLCAPVTIARFVMSGYPLFPSALGAYPVEWAYDPAALEPLRIYIRDFVRWSWQLPPYNLESSRYSTGWFDFTWLPRWLAIETVLALYLVLSFIVGVILLRQASQRDVLPWIVGVAWVGMAYVFVTAPTLRYGVSFFVMLPTLWIAHLITDRRTTQALWALIVLLVITIAGMGARTVWLGFTLHRVAVLLTIAIFTAYAGLVVGSGASTPTPQPVGFNRRPIGRWMGAVGGVLFAVALFASVFRFGQASQLSNILVRPRALRTPEVMVKRINDVAVYQPVQGPCWAAPLPCGLEIDPRIALRNPQRGLAAGFKRQAR